MSADQEDRPATILSQFQAIGASFILPVEEITQRLAHCRAIVFDWDGVFNTGRKGQAAGSDFAEADAMGTNMLRYGLWRELGQLPYIAIISGEDNDNAIRFAEREHLTDVYTGVKNKRLVVEHLCKKESLEPEQVACVFDDINDLSMAAACGLRFMVRRDSSPLLADYAARHSLCDYISGSDSSDYAVREICELMLGLLGSFDLVVDSRVAYDDDYRAFWEERQAVVTESLTNGDFGERD